MQCSAANGKYFFPVLLSPVVIAVSLAWQRIDAIRSSAEKTNVSTMRNIVMTGSRKSGYTFRAPMVMPRNTQNTPADLEKDVLAELASTNLSEKIIPGPRPTFQSLKQAGDAPHV